jgi:hypothetical protein
MDEELVMPENVTYSTPLADKLKPVDEALARLRAATAFGGNYDVFLVLDGLTEIVRELARSKWTDGAS